MSAATHPRRSRPDLAALARRVERLAPSHRDPEAYHAEKSEIVAELRKADRDIKGRG